VIGVVIGVKALSSAPEPGPTRPQPAASGSTGPNSGGKPLALRPDQLRVVDPPRGNRSEVKGAEKVIDGNESTGWSTEHYQQANFGGIKPGMGILINLGEAKKVTAVKVSVNTQGASVSLRAGTADPGDTTEGDKTIADGFTVLGPTLDDFPGTNMVLPVPESQQTVQYLLVWITKLPQTAPGSFALTINEIVVLTP
jgi:eukaryotic-like serine/threonine-protein kinase